MKKKENLPAELKITSRAAKQFVPRLEQFTIRPIREHGGGKAQNRTPHYE